MTSTNIGSYDDNSQKKKKKSGVRSGSSAAAKDKQERQSESDASFPIVAIGASAGGLEAFTAFFSAVAPDLEMAYAVITHLDPSRKSAFPQILARVTTMPVVQIGEGMRVLPRHVYVIPPNCDLTIAGGVLHISDRAAPRSFNTTIDIFMRSLAADQGSNAIGVILSGTASDGTLGLTAIKSEGGITFAQDEQSAKYGSMPASAVAAGCVDFVLPPEAIARELAHIRRHPFVGRSEQGPAEIEDRGQEADASIAQVFRLLRRTTKVDFSEYKPPTISRRIQRRMVLQRIEKLSDYVALLHRDRNEVSALYQDLLINVTSFFRNPEAFETLKQVVYPVILRARQSSAPPIRIWVPGCSTGEEAYSHAMSLIEFLADEHLEVPIQLFGTDLSEVAIQRARAGVYKDGIEPDVSPARLRRFFHKFDGGYQISKTIRDLCIFSTQNVLRDPPFSRMDLVSCRNVMIYLNQTLQRRIIPTFHYALNPTGFLMIGSTEGLLGAGSELFEMADKKQKIYRKKLVSTPATFGFFMPAERRPDGHEPSSPPLRQPELAKASMELQREADRLLLARYAPPAVVVNDQLEILQSRGHTGLFFELPPGKASLNLLKLARPGIAFELQKAMDSARKTGTEIARENAHFQDDGSTQVTTVRVIPFRVPLQDQSHFLTVFEPVHSAPSAAVPPPLPAEPSEKDGLIAQLRQEIASTKDYLQAIIESQEASNEELQSANEEIQSGNEELQSTNEELQTSKEELESANEELHTVNEEMQHRNDLLSQLNNDLTNFLNSVHLAIVMVGPDLSVRRFTPQATNVLGLMANDVGRPLPKLRLKIDAANLEQLMLSVIHEAQAKQYDVQDHEGNWYRLHINPYRTLDNRIEGAVITIVDPKNPGFSDESLESPSRKVPRRKRSTRPQ